MNVKMRKSILLFSLSITSSLKTDFLLCENLTAGFDIRRSRKTMSILQTLVIFTGRRISQKLGLFWLYVLVRHIGCQRFLVTELLQHSLEKVKTLFRVTVYWYFKLQILPSTNCDASLTHFYIFSLRSLANVVDVITFP